MDEKMNHLIGNEIEFTRDDACAWPWPKVADPVMGHTFRANELVRKLFGDRERVTAVDVRTWLADVSSAKVAEIPFQTDFSDLRKHLNLRVDVFGTVVQEIHDSDVGWEKASAIIQGFGKLAETYRAQSKVPNTTNLPSQEKQYPSEDVPQRNEPMSGAERQLRKEADFMATYGGTAGSILGWAGDPELGVEKAKEIQDAWKEQFQAAVVGAPGYPDVNRGGDSYEHATMSDNSIRRSSGAQGKSRYLDKFAAAVEKLGYRAKRTLTASPRHQAGVDIVSRVSIPASIPIADVRKLVEETHDVSQGWPTLRTNGDEHIILTFEAVGQIKALWEQDAQRLLASKHTGPVTSKPKPSFYSKPDADDFTEVAPKVGSKAALGGVIDSTPFVVQVMREELVDAMRTMPADKLRRVASVVEKLLKEV